MGGLHLLTVVALTIAVSALGREDHAEPAATSTNPNTPTMPSNNIK